MTIDEIREKKAATEKAIRDILIEFSCTTGLVVDGIQFEMIPTTMDGNHKIACTQVEIYTHV